MATAAELKARLAKYSASKKEQENVISEQASSSVATTAPAESVRTEAVSENAEVVARQNGPEITVVTDVQSTDVVIVERPNETVVDSNTTDDSRSNTDLDISNPIHQGFLQRLADLETALLERDPLMKTHLGAIHKTMIEYEEIANLLRPEEIAKIMAAQQQHTGIVLRAETLGKSKAATNKKAAQLGLGDL